MFYLLICLYNYLEVYLTAVQSTLKLVNSRSPPASASSVTKIPSVYHLFNYQV